MIRAEREEPLKHVGYALEFFNLDELEALEEMIARAKNTLLNRRADAEGAAVVCRRLNDLIPTPGEGSPNGTLLDVTG